MHIHADILQDFGKALADFKAVLTQESNREVVRDAQIFSFIRANEILKALINNLYAENTDDDLHDPEQMLIALCALDLIAEDQVKRLIEQIDCADYLALDRTWLDAPEDAEYFDEEVASFPTYYDDMKTLYENLYRVGTLLRYEECYESH